jgi:cyclase
MLKKRIIFTLLYSDGHFVLSRNFRLQKVGDAEWLRKNYNFARIAFYIDELVVLDVSRGERNTGEFCKALQTIAQGVFAPIAAGGGITTVKHARELFHSGADKVVVNTALFENPHLPKEIAKEFGQQSIIASIDLKRDENNTYQVYTNNGSKKISELPRTAINSLPPETIGEIYLNSIDRDGTGQGYDFDALDILPQDWTTPVILAGGVGNSSHLLAGIKDERVDAVATAHLFNFVGDGLRKARLNLLSEGTPLAEWPALTEVGFGNHQTGMTT